MGAYQDSVDETTPERFDTALNKSLIQSLEPSPCNYSLNAVVCHRGRTAQSGEFC